MTALRKIEPELVNELSVSTAKLRTWTEALEIIADLRDDILAEIEAELDLHMAYLVDGGDLRGVDHSEINRLARAVEVYSRMCAYLRRAG